MNTMPQNEIARPIKIDDIGTSPLHLELSTTPDERDAVARRLDVVSLDRFDGDIDIRRTPGKQFLVEGSIRADLVQSCVVTGDPVPISLSFALRRVYEEGADPFAGLAEDEDEIVTELEDDDPDAPINGIIDVGEAAVEELALQIPAYPRKPDAVFEEVDPSSGDTDGRENPFAALADLKNRLKTE